jgi:hypothetical protein
MAFLHSASLNQLSDGGFVFQGRERGELCSSCLRTWATLTSRCRISQHIQKLGGTGNKFFQSGGRFCIAHLPGDEAEKTYRRRSMLAKRKQIMESWAAFSAKQQAKVISIKTGLAA